MNGSRCLSSNKDGDGSGSDSDGDRDSEDNDEEDILAKQAREREQAAADVTGAVLGAIVALLAKEIARDAVGTAVPKQVSWERSPSVVPTTLYWLTFYTYMKRSYAIGRGDGWSRKPTALTRYLRCVASSLRVPSLGKIEQRSSTKHPTLQEPPIVSRRVRRRDIALFVLARTLQIEVFIVLAYDNLA